MKRTWLSLALVHTGVSEAVLARRRRSRSSWILALTYHRIATSHSLGDLDPGVATDVGQFELQLEFLRSHFDFIGIDDLVGALDGKPLPSAPVLLTFDDGYRDNRDVVLPLLEKYGARGVFFIATQFVNQRRLFWWDRVHWVLQQARVEVLELAYPNIVSLPLDTHDARARAERYVLNVIKTHFALDLPRFLAELDEAAGVSLSSAEEKTLADRHVMSWDDVRALDHAAMDVQSHSHTHRVLQTLDRAQLDAELHISRALLLRAIGRTPVAMSYPVGRATTYSGEIRTALRMAGYRLGFSNRTGVIPRAGFDAHDIHRMSVEGETASAFFESVLAFPSLAY